MADRNKRMKASDVFSASTPFLGTTSDVTRAFPTIAAATVDVESRFSPTGEEREYSTRSDLREFIDCTNPRCYNGGFPLGAMLRLMEGQRQTEQTFTRSCQGYESSAKGRRNYGPCDNHFTVKVRISFKDGV